MKTDKYTLIEPAISVTTFTLVVAILAALQFVSAG